MRQHFHEEDAAALAELPAGKVLWGIPLYASDPGLHDEIVGKQGAFASLIDSLALLARGGAAIELRTVLMTANADVAGGPRRAPRRATPLHRDVGHHAA